MTPKDARRLAAQLKALAFRDEVRESGYDPSGLVTLSAARGVDLHDYTPFAVLIEAARICETFARVPSVIEGVTDDWVERWLFDEEEAG